MGKFNTPTNVINPNKSQKTVTHQGGVGYTYPAFMKLYSLLSTKKFNGDNFYLTEKQEVELLKQSVRDCITQHGAETTAKLIVYIRTNDGHRTASHIATVELMKHISNSSLAKRMFTKWNRKAARGGVIFRVDDAMEIASYYMINKALESKKDLAKFDRFKGINLPNGMRKGFKKMLEDCDWHELGKYQLKGKAISLKDLIHLVHPESTKSKAWKWFEFNEYEEYMEKFIKNFPHLEKSTRNRIKIAKEKSIGGKIRVAAFEAATHGFLFEENTMESKNSATGQDIANQVKTGIITKEQAEEKFKDQKAENYLDLIKSKKIGYLALIRQLSQIHDLVEYNNDLELLKFTNALLIDESKIKSPGNLVWPYQIEQAREILMLKGTKTSKQIVVHLDRAFDMSCANLSELGFNGNTTVVVDDSGSMSSFCGSSDFNKFYSELKLKPKSHFEVGVSIAAPLLKGTFGELYFCATSCREISYDPGSSAMAISNTIRTSYINGGGTNLSAIFNTIKPCDRVIVITDEQHGSHANVYTAFKQWKAKYDIQAYLYIINVNSYGVAMVPVGDDKTIRHVAGYSFETLKTLTEIEVDPKALFKKVNEVNLEPTGSW